MIQYCYCSVYLSPHIAVDSGQESVEIVRSRVELIV